MHNLCPTRNEVCRGYLQGISPKYLAVKTYPWTILVYAHCSMWSILPICTWSIPLGKIKWNESGFRPLLCTYRLNRDKRTSWGCMVRWMRWHCLPDTGFEIRIRRSKVEHATSRSQSFTSGWERNIFVSCKPPRPGNEPRTAWKVAVLTTTLGPPPILLCATAYIIRFL